MKHSKLVIPIFLTAALFGTVAYHVSTKMETARQYEAALQQARSLSEKGIETDAMTSYSQALTIDRTLEISLEAGEVYLKNDDLYEAQNWYKNQLLSFFPHEPETYLYGLRVYLAGDDYRNAFSVYEDYQSRGLYLQEMEDRVSEIKYMFDLSGQYEGAGPFSNTAHLAAVEYNGLWGYVDATGRRAVPYDYADAGTFSTLAPVTDTFGQACYLDETGDVKINENFILESDPDFGHVVRFQAIQSGMILAYNGEIWNFYDSETMAKLFGGYKDAVPVTMGVGAVSNGEKWALIGSDGEYVTDFLFDDVAVDEKGVFCRTAAVIVKQDGAYYLTDSTGNRLSDGFDQAYAFYDGTYAACANGQQWSFVDDQGNVAFTGEYEDARSFSNGFAAVKTDGKWGYIDLDGNIVIDCQFDEAGPFNDTGVSFVKNGEFWQMLKLYQYNHD